MLRGHFLILHMICTTHSVKTISSVVLKIETLSILKHIFPSPLWLSVQTKKVFTSV